MKKRRLSILLALCTAVCFLTTGMFARGETGERVGTKQGLVNASADGTALRSVAVQNIGPNEVEVENDLYEKISVQVSFIKLISDIELGSSLSIDYEVTVDLNGHVLKMADDAGGSVITVGDKGRLTLIDGNPTAEHKFTPDTEGLWVPDETSGTKTVRGGVITGGTGYKNGDSAYGGGVYIEPGGKLTMTGGSIAGCTAIAAQLSASAIGGGICNKGTTSLSGTAEIRDCHTTHAGKLFGGVYDSGVLRISGDVRITGCRAGDLESDAMYVNSGSTVDGGFFDGTVINCGKITGGIFEKELTNISGMITGGIFYGGITNENGGKIGGITVTYKDGNADYAKQVLQSGTLATRPDDPAKDGYIFIGWYGGNTAYDFTDPVTDGIILTAKWAKISDKTADFTASDGGAAAISLLNSTKTGAENSVWDNSAKTLTLKGVSFATTATTAVKLPDGATVILADGAENRIIGGGGGGKRRCPRQKHHRAGDG